MRRAVAVAGEVDHGQRVGDFAVDFLPRHLLALEAVADVIGNAEVRENRVALEHHVGRALVGGDARHRLPGDDNSAVGRLVKPGDQTQQRGLAAARRAEQGEELAFPDGRIDAAERGDGAKGLADAFDFDDGVLCHLHQSSGRGCILALTAGGAAAEHLAQHQQEHGKHQQDRPQCHD